MEFMDIFNDDAFGLVSMTAAVNQIDNIPGRAGQLAFAGVGEGVATTAVGIEQRAETLGLIQTSPRGSPAPQESENKATLRNVSIPQIKEEQRIGAHEVQGVRAFGSTNQLRTVQSVVDRQVRKITRKMDMTLEYHRLGALKGRIKDADGSKLLDLYDLFGIAIAPDFDFDLTNASADVRTTCQNVIRFMRRNAKTTLPPGHQVWAFCGDNFFDRLIKHASVTKAYENYTAAATRLGDSYAQSVFPFAGINFENYAGTDDQTATTEGTVGIHPDECRFFLTGVPGLYAEYYAPADFWDTVNTIGLPRYAKIVPDDDMQRFVTAHVQMNPLPLCLRPKTLCRGVYTASVSSDEPASAT